MKNYKRSFRLVCQEHEISLVEELLKLQGFTWEADSFTPTACRLIEEPFSLGSSLAAFFGFIYIQDRASMLPPVALNPPKGASVLDMCASPGSKTGQLSMLVGKEGFVLGNEPSPSRLATLRRNLQQMGFTQSITCCNEGQKLHHLPNEFFDYIQLDPPCSGWGTIEKNPKVMDMWKEEKTLPLIRLQKELLAEATRLLRPNGSLVYSTCTTNVEENEAQLIYAQEELGLVVEDLAPLPEFVMDDPLLNCGAVWRLSPRLGDTQGFFVAKLRKKEDAPKLFENTACASEDAQWGETLNKNHLAELGITEDFLQGGSISSFGESIHFVPKQAKYLPKSFNWQGMYMGKISKYGDIQLSPRVLVGENLPCMDFEGLEGINAIKGLLAGQSLSCDFKAKNALMRWNGLVLGRLRVKNKRVLWSER